MTLALEARQLRVEVGPPHARQAVVRDVSVEDAIRPESDGFSLRRELHMRGAATGLYVQLANQKLSVYREPFKPRRRRSELRSQQS